MVKLLLKVLRDLLVGSANVDALSGKSRCIGLKLRRRQFSVPANAAARRRLRQKSAPTRSGIQANVDAKPRASQQMMTLRLGLSYRQMKRLVGRYRQQGPHGTVSNKRDTGAGEAAGASRPYVARRAAPSRGRSMTWKPDYVQTRDYTSRAQSRMVLTGVRTTAVRTRSVKSPYEGRQDKHFVRRGSGRPGARRCAQGRYGVVIMARRSSLRQAPSRGVGGISQCLGKEARYSDCCRVEPGGT